MRDSSPISVIEAMSLGKPSIVTSTGGIPELVVDSETGLVVPPNDSRALERALLALLRDRKKAAELGEGARRRFELRHRQEFLVEPLQQLFTELAALRT
jgi:glycosyltransferase involved in cell wall biosynthesis